MAYDVEELNETVSRCRDMLNMQETKREEFVSMIDRLEKEIGDRVEQLKKAIDSEKIRLLEDLERRKKDRTEKIQRAIENIEQHMSFARSLIRYTEELGNNGTPSDVAQQRSALHNRADELKRFDNIHSQISDLGSVSVKFEATTRVKGSENLVGQIQAHWQRGEGKYYDRCLFLNVLCVYTMHVFCSLWLLFQSSCCSGVNSVYSERSFCQICAAGKDTSVSHCDILGK
jgi:DNA repair exonuclease SbcCD ATPase subunit